MDRICTKTVSRKWQEVPRNEPANVSGNNIIFTESMKQITSIILVAFDSLYLNKIYAEFIIPYTKLDTKKISPGWRWHSRPPGQPHTGSATTIGACG
ncbi:MAG: hypothetical protein LBH02_03505 [Methanocalculaceae archaeon]|nr:hypothetical protein [Methanocalculaceae archaeon]